MIVSTALAMALVWLLALCGPTAANAANASEPEPDTPRQSLQRAEGLRAYSIDLPGRALDAAPLPASLGGGLAVLTVETNSATDAPDEEADDLPRALWRITFGPPVSEDPLRGDDDRASGTEARIERLTAALPAVESLLVPSPSTSSGASSDELWLVAEGSLFRLERADGRFEAREVLSSPDLLPRTFSRDESAGLVDAELVALPTVGALRLFARGRDDRSLDGRAEVRELVPVGSRRLPVAARQTRHGLLLSSPRVRRLPGAAGWAAGPEAMGAERLRMTLVTRSAPPSATTDSSLERAAASSDAWLRLPGPEVVQSSWILEAGGRTLLALATTGSSEINLFETLSLRVYPLDRRIDRPRADVSRAGTGPILRTDLVSRRWFIPEVATGDLDGDGHDELIVLQPKGLESNELRIEVFPGRSSGGFGGRPRRVDLDLERAAWTWGADFDGDGLPDLAAFADGELTIHRGRASGRPVDRRSWRRVEPLAFRPIRAPGDDDPPIEQETDLDGREPPPVRYSGRPRALQIDDDPTPELVVLDPGSERSESAGSDLVVIDLDSAQE